MTRSVEPDCPSLWSFTVDRYARPGVQRSTISLQNHQNADVNFLFYCAWSAVTGRRRLDAEIFADLERRVARWRDQVTRPLRSLRDHIKVDRVLAGLDGAMGVREKILNAEIDSERVAQLVMESAAGSRTDTSEGSQLAVAESNLRAYLAFIDADVDETVENDLQTFLRGVFEH